MKKHKRKNQNDANDGDQHNIDPGDDQFSEEITRLLESGSVCIPQIVERSEDLNPRETLIINPPPPDGRCECCGRAMDELTPFGGPGDPLDRDFTGALLIPTYRIDEPYDEEADNAQCEALNCFEHDGYQWPRDWMIAKYGKEEGERLFLAGPLNPQDFESWECRDCVILDQDEYWEKRLNIPFGTGEWRKKEGKPNVEKAIDE